MKTNEILDFDKKGWSIDRFFTVEAIRVLNIIELFLFVCLCFDRYRFVQEVKPSAKDSSDISRW